MSEFDDANDMNPPGVPARDPHEVGAGTRRVAERQYLRIGWPWNDPEWPNLPPAVITTERVKRDFDLLRAHLGLPPLHYPERIEDTPFRGLLDRLRSGVRVDKCEPLTESAFRQAVDQMRYVQPIPSPPVLLVHPGVREAYAWALERTRVLERILAETPRRRRIRRYALRRLLGRSRLEILWPWAYRLKRRAQWARIEWKHRNDPLW